jgi:acyl-coenzyme A thioesterase PaaI-like protein
MTLADVGPYIAILATIGWVPLAVTINLSINFLRKPPQRDLFAEARLIKLGKRLVVSEIGIRSDGDDDLVAHATSTYSIPPGR